MARRIPGVAALVALIVFMALAALGLSEAAAQTADAPARAAAATAAAPDPLQKARQAMQKARQALNKARFTVNQNRRTRRTAAEALARARAAQSAAGNAASAAASATADAAEALAVAQQARDDATRANGRLDAAATASDKESATVSTTNAADYESLGGPQVNVTVPASGLIEVWASVEFGDGVEPPDGLVALYEDGQPVVIEGQDTICGSATIDQALISAFGSLSGDPLTLSTPPSSSVFGLGCGTIGAAPAPVLLQRPPGTHTYELRYAWGDCGCSSAGVFANRTLTVAARP